MPKQVIVEVRLLAQSRRTTPTVVGSIVWVSADRIESDRTRPANDAARVEVDETQLASLHGVRLCPGMPVDVIIVTGKRSMLDHLVAPIERLLAMSLNEQ